MREQILRKAMGKSLRMAAAARARSGLPQATSATSSPSSPSSTSSASASAVHVVGAPAGTAAAGDSPGFVSVAGCPVQHLGKMSSAAAAPNTRGVFTQTGCPRSAATTDTLASAVSPARDLNPAPPPPPPPPPSSSSLRHPKAATATATAAAAAAAVSDSDSSEVVRDFETVMPTTASTTVSAAAATAVRSFDEMPGPKGYPIVGTLLEYFRKENHGRMHEIQRRNHRLYGSIFKEPFGPAKNVCVADPSIVEEILRSEGQFPNRPPYESWVLYNTLRKRRGGVMTSQGEYWKTSRRAMNPKLMRPQSVGEFIESMNSTTIEFISRLRQLKAAQPDGQSVKELPLELNKYTMEAVGKILLNVRIGTLDSDISPNIKEFIDAIGTMFLTGHQLMAFAKVHQILRTKAWRQHVQAWDTIYALSNEMIAEQVDATRQRLEEEPDSSDHKMDLISHMVSAGTLTRDEIIDNLTETFMGGVDTVANGVSFLLYLLATNQPAQDRLRKEVDSVLGRRSCTLEDLQAIPYVKAVVKETIRLFPPIPLNARVTQEEIVLSNYKIPKGTIIMLNNYTMSRDERIFSDPDSFHPDRWLRAEVASWHPFSAIPFGYGVRSCLGRRVAENLMYVAAIQMVQQFVMKKDPSFDIMPTVRTQFTPGPELPILFEER